MDTKSHIGIWLDKRNAIIVKLKGEGALVKEIPSNVDEGHARGGSRSSTPWGPQDAIAERHLSEKQRQQLRAYFQQIMEEVYQADRIMIMGPASTKHRLFLQMQEDYNFDQIPVCIETQDVMTIPQIKARVKEYFQKTLA